MESSCNTQNKNIATIKLEEIHPSWIEALPNGQLIKRLILQAGSNSPLIEYTTQKLTGIKSIELKGNPKTTKLIHKSSAEVLNNIILMAGAAQFSKQFSRTISQQEVRIIKDSLGEEVYKFSLYEVPLTFPNLLKIEERNHIQINTNKPFIKIISAGYRSLKIALEKTPNNCCYKLPKQWEESYLIEKNSFKPDRKERLLHKDLILFLFERSHCNKGLNS